MFRVMLTRQALKDLDRLKQAGLGKKASAIKDILCVNPFQNPPPYEKLVGDLAGLYSRRINSQHRIVYSVEQTKENYEGLVRILRMWTHYE